MLVISSSPTASRMSSPATGLFSPRATHESASADLPFAWSPETAEDPPEEAAEAASASLRAFQQIVQTGHLPLPSGRCVLHVGSRVPGNDGRVASRG
jgi:hypothetical protein